MRFDCRRMSLACTPREGRLRQQLKPQGARNGCSFYQTDIDNVPQPVHGSAARADQRVTRFVVVEVLASKRADRDQPVGAGIVEFDEEPGAGDAGNPASKGGADTVSEKMGDQPVGCLALSL